MKAKQAACLGIVILLILVHSAMASVSPVFAGLQVDSFMPFPSPAQLPSGMVLAEQGSRSAEAIAATFPDPDDAELVLETWGWAFNAYRVYVSGTSAGPDTPARLEISFHQFSSNTGAAYALPYFAHGRAVMLDQVEGPVTQLRPCEAAVTGEREATLYLRIDDLLVRVTVAMPDNLRPNNDVLAQGWSAEVALAILTNSGGSIQALNQTCQ